jgi:hypothetical protein
MKQSCESGMQTVALDPPVTLRRGLIALLDVGHHICPVRRQVSQSPISGHFGHNTEVGHFYAFFVALPHCCGAKPPIEALNDVAFVFCPVLCV